MNKRINRLLEGIRRELGEAVEKIKPKDVEEFAEVEDTIKSLIKGQYGGHPPNSMDFKKIAARCPMSAARMRSLIKRYPKTVASWFGGKDLDFEKAAPAKGSGAYVKPFTHVVRPSKATAAYFSVVK